MAGDWMKIELELPDKPEVHAMASILNIDSDSVVGKLIRVWQWFNKHTTDGNAHGVTFSLPDRISGVNGFGEAMQFVGWLEQHDKTLHMPKFDRHTSESAKQRALTARRVNKHKAKSNVNVNDDGVTLPLPREEKRREDIKRGLPEDFSISDGVKIWAQKNGYSQLDKHFDNFIDSCLAKGYKYKDWDAAFRNAIKNNWANVEPKKPNGLVF